MISVALCDDDSMQLKELEETLRKEKRNFSITSFSNGQELLAAMRTQKFSVFFMDIELGDTNGYELSKKIRALSGNAVIIFVSSHEEYACEAYEIDALRFLKKPYDKDKLLEAADKAEQQVKKRNVIFKFQKQGITGQINLANVCYVERRQRTVVFHLLSGKELEIYGALKNLEKEFDQDLFVRCHTGYLVNLSYVSELQDSSILLDNGEQIPMSRGQRQKVREAYMDYCWEKEERIR